MFCRKALLPFGSHDSPPVQRIAAETVETKWLGCEPQLIVMSLDSES